MFNNIDLFKDINFIFITGPNRSGKDTFAKKIKQHFLNKNKTVQILRLADPLKFYYKQKFDPKNLLKEEDFKQQENREKLYWFSLKMKDVEGKSFFCREVLKRINEEETDIVIVPDLRFNEEYIFFINNLNKYKIVRIIDSEEENGNDNCVTPSGSRERFREAEPYLLNCDINEFHHDFYVKKFDEFINFDNLV